jgi:hypothetical protein
MRVPGDLLGHMFRHPLDHRFAAGLAHAFRGGVGHLLHVAIGRVVEHKNFSHPSVSVMLVRSN